MSKYPDRPEQSNIATAVELFVKKASANTICSHDGLPGAAYVDTLRGDDVGLSTVLLSYTWGYKLKSVTGALKRWVEREEFNPRSTYVWICALCLNQHRMVRISVA